MKAVAIAILSCICTASCSPVQSPPPRGEDQIPQVEGQVPQAEAQLPQEAQVIRLTDQMPPSPVVAPRCAAPYDPPVDWCEPIHPNDSVQTQLERIAGCFVFAIVATGNEPDDHHPFSDFLKSAISAMKSCNKNVPPGLELLQKRYSERISLADGSGILVQHETTFIDFIPRGIQGGTSSVWRFFADGHTESVEKTLSLRSDGEWEFLPDNGQAK
jgi:hypothetical protein